ncbi:MAG TPA: helix-hairpin-helix domain-containing protein, partial [Candidatus Paceibacterota bacterium]|nr:helix-hairpin-helix domain-containing protein [Candidatus Paceibacterota bacterium]
MLFLSRAEAKLGLFFLVFLFTLAAFCVQAAEPAEKIDINTASLEELQKITGVGPVMGQRIIEARPFVSVQDLI